MKLNQIISAFLMSALVVPAAMAKSAGPMRSRPAHLKIHKSAKVKRVAKRPRKGGGKGGKLQPVPEV